MKYLGRFTPFVGVLVFAFAFLTPAPASAELSYTLHGPLKNGSCLNDLDNDCLDNNMENLLAFMASPWVFFDENETCHGRGDAWQQLHFKRRDFFQVRPRGSAIRNWSATDGTTKWVAVTYFLNYPHDCADISIFGFGGHQGDSEHVRYIFRSTDLTTWVLDRAEYAHHNEVETISGSFLAAKAGELNTIFPSITADEDSHGSWAGVAIDSDDCSTSDAFVHDCFITNWQWDLQNTVVDWPNGINVGGPSPERWIASDQLTVLNGEAFSDLDTGHGVNREFWTPKGGAFQKFCGWQCPSNERDSDGDCDLEFHAEHECAGGHLSTKVDTSGFTIDPPAPPPSTSCTGKCGQWNTAGDCSCAHGCREEGNCCSDSCRICGVCLVKPYGSSEPLTSSLSTFLDELGQEAVAPRAIEPVAVDPQRVARARGLAASAVARLRREAGADPASRDGHRRWLARRAEDPVAALVPLVLGLPKEEQLRTFQWLLTFPERARLAGLFDDLRERTEDHPQALGEEAHERILDLVHLLASERGSKSR